MILLFAGGDVGGARALLPVAKLAHATGHEVVCAAHGVFQAEGDVNWRWLAPELARLADEVEPDAVLYATSVADWTAWEIARAAAARGCPTLHLLDNWSSYALRLLGPDGDRFLPSIYAVIDEEARADAEADGVPPELIAVTGHPDLADLSEETRRLAPPARASGAPAECLFVSEPARADSAAGTPGFRGYDEVEVLSLFADCLARLPEPNFPKLRVAPHPREDVDQVSASWDELCDAIATSTGRRPELELLSPGEVRPALHSANIVVGMTSILLYQAWLLGKAVASLQPGLRVPSLRSLEQREGLLFLDSRERTLQVLPDWLAHPPSAPRSTALRELDQHTRAPARVLDLAAGLAARPR